MSDSDSDSPVTKKAKKDDNKPRPLCPYGAKCYRKNPIHFKEFSHPTKDGKTKGKCVKIDTDSLPSCPYGANCYRKNLLHFAEFSHPVKAGGPLGLAAMAAEEDSGEDTEEYSETESDDEASTSKGKVKKADKRVKAKPSINKIKTVKMEKSYSKMTEVERRDLIKRAMEAKKNLEEELKVTKSKMEEKEKEIQRLQNEVSTGVLLMDGEKEALEGNEIKYFPLAAERAYKEGSAAQVHFRLAESQFYRLLSGQQYRVTRVEYVVNPKLSKMFKAAMTDLKKERGEALSYPVLAFHGTAEANITPICETGFKVPGEKGFKHATDTGYYGKGVYFSEYPAYSIGYIKGATKLLLCQVLPGKVYQCTKLIHGHPLKSGYDSHTSPDKKELIIFNSHHIMPSYIVHYKVTMNKEFKYVKPVEERRRIDKPEELMKLYMKALKTRKSTKLVGKTIEFDGKLCDTHFRLGELVKKHGGTYGAAGATTTALFGINCSTILVCSEEAFNDKSTVVTCAISLSKQVVREEYLYDSIVNKELTEPEDYAFD